MIIAKAPVRISFVGGATDLPSYYQFKNWGAVVSSTIRTYVYIMLNPKWDGTIRASYSQTENVTSVSKLKHKVIKQALMHRNIKKGIEVVSVADVHGRGSGLGSSSAFTVALLHGLHSYEELAGIHIAKDTLAEEAFHVEHNLCHYNCGKQDQYASAFGGLNFFKFNFDGTVEREHLHLQSSTVRHLNTCLQCFDTGVGRASNRILRDQIKRIDDSLEAYDDLKLLALELRDELRNNSLHRFGELVHQGWELKKQMYKGISAGWIDDIYNYARSQGAVGGKISGAGGGGFMWFFVPKKQKQFQKAMIKKFQLNPLKIWMEDLHVGDFMTHGSVDKVGSQVRQF